MVQPGGKYTLRETTSKFALEKQWLEDEICIFGMWSSGEKKLVSGSVFMIINDITIYSQKTPTYPWNIPQTLNYLFMKEILSYLYLGYLGLPRVCWNLLRYTCYIYIYYDCTISIYCMKWANDFLTSKKVTDFQMFACS